MDIRSLKPSVLARCKQVFTLLLRHGSLDLLRAAQKDLGSVLEDVEYDAGAPEKLTDDLEALGPTFVKLGQLMSSRADLLPEPYVDALSRLHDAVDPFGYEQVRETVREELGGEPEALFADFARQPLASASLGQVHRAKLPGGKAVAVKVQRPGVRRTIVDDFEAFDAVAALLDKHTDLGRRYGFVEMVDEVRATLLRELDYQTEAQNLERLGGSLEDQPLLLLPHPVRRLTSARVLTMDYIEGTSIAEIDDGRRRRLDGPAIAEQLCEAYLEQMLLEGCFHADPHPGNVLVTAQQRLGLIDLGTVAYLSPGFRRSLFRMLLAIGEGDSDRVAEICVSVGRRLDDYDRTTFQRKVTRLVGEARGARLERGGLGKLVFALGRAGAESGIRPPAELAIVGRTVLYLDKIGAMLDPAFRIEDVIRDRLSSVAGRQVLRGLKPRRGLVAALELNEFVQQLPRRLNDVLEAVTERELEVRVRAFDESDLFASLRRVGTRITLGLLFSAWIVAAALIMRTDVEPKLFGYPALAVVLLSIGALAAAALVGIILWHDFWKGRS